MPPKAKPAGDKKKSKAKKPKAEERTLRLSAKGLPVLTDARRLRVCCSHLPPRLPTSPFADPFVVLDLARDEEAPFERLGHSEILDPWLSEKDEEMLELQAAGLDFGDRVSERDEEHELWTRASFKQRVHVVWRANGSARLRVRLYYCDAETMAGEASELIHDSDLIAEATLPLNAVVRHGKRSEEPASAPFVAVEGGHEVELKTVGGVETTLTVHAESEEEPAKRGLRLNPCCEVWAQASKADDFALVGCTEAFADPTARAAPAWKDEPPFPLDSFRLRVDVYVTPVPGPAAAVGAEPEPEPEREFVGRGELYTAELLEVEEVRMNVGLKTRGEDGAHDPLPTIFLTGLRGSHDAALCSDRRHRAPLRPRRGDRPRRRAGGGLSRLSGQEARAGAGGHAGAAG